MGNAAHRGPAEGIWSGADVAPLTNELIGLGARLMAAAPGGAGPADAHERSAARIAELERATSDPAARARGRELVTAARGTSASGASASDAQGDVADPVATALLLGSAAVLGGDRGDAATIAFAALGGSGRVAEGRLRDTVAVAALLAERIAAVLEHDGPVPPARSALPAATLAAGVAVGLATDLDEAVLARAVGLMASCVVGQAPPATTRGARALAVGRAAGDVVLALALVGEGFTTNARALEAPRGLVDALTGRAPEPGRVALIREGAAAGAAPVAIDGPLVAPDTDPTLMALATFVAEGVVDADARHAARRTLANAVGLMVGAADADAVRIAASVVLPHAGAPEALVPGRSDRMSAAAAAFLGGIATHYEDFDDTHLRTVAHPGAAVPPAVLALAQTLGSDWDATLDAVAVGVEAMLRVADGMSPDHLDRGWHVTATTGHLGAAAGCARLLGLDAATTAHAMGLALVTATGTQSVLGTMAKPFHPGRAARDGVEAALLASYGWTAPSGALEGPHGFAASLSADPDLAFMTSELGTRWELANNAFKPYACGIVAHPSIDAGIALRDLVPDPDDVESVELEVNPFTLTAMGLAEPGPGLEGKFSVHHGTAVGYLVGRAGPDEFTDARVLDPAVIAVRRRLRFIPSERIARDAVDVVATTRGGQVHRFGIEHATGSVDRPMTDAQLHAKIVAEAARTLGEAAARSLADRLFAAEAGDVHGVVELATP